MSKPTYEELETEVRRLRAKLSVGEDKEFTKELKSRMPGARFLVDYEKNGKYTLRPGEIWFMVFGTEANTRELAKLGRSLTAMGWTRSARLGNVVFTLPVDEY